MKASGKVVEGVYFFKLKRCDKATTAVAKMPFGTQRATAIIAVSEGPGPVSPYWLAQSGENGVHWPT